MVKETMKPETELTIYRACAFGNVTAMIKALKETNKPRKIVEISRSCKIHYSQVSKWITRLEKLGFVRTHKEGRCKFVEVIE